MGGFGVDADEDTLNRVHGMQELLADASDRVNEPMTGKGGSLPHLDTLEAAFGMDLSWIQFFQCAKERGIASALGATAFAAGTTIYSETTELFTIAHEVAHCIQQRLGWVPSRYVSKPGDRFEVHADEVAAAVVAGRPVAPLMEAFAPSAAAHGEDMTRERRRNNVEPGYQDQLAGMLANAAPEKRAVIIKEMNDRRWLSDRNYRDRFNELRTQVARGRSAAAPEGVEEVVSQAAKAAGLSSSPTSSAQAPAPAVQRKKGGSPAEELRKKLHADEGSLSKLDAALIQFRMAALGRTSGDVGAIAAQGFRGPAQPLPHLDRVQPLFGSHDITGVQAFVDGPAKHAAESLGAVGYASNGRVALGSDDLFTVAHEAAHVVQQRAGKGRRDDPGLEAHADAVAAAVVRGESAVDLLNQVSGNTSHSACSGDVQLKREPEKALTPRQRMSKQLSRLMVAEANWTQSKGVDDSFKRTTIPEQIVFLLDFIDKTLNQAMTVADGEVHAALRVLDFLNDRMPGGYLEGKQPERLAKLTKTAKPFRAAHDVEDKWNKKLAKVMESVLQPFLRQDPKYPVAKNEVTQPIVALLRKGDWAAAEANLDEWVSAQTNELMGTSDIVVKLQTLQATRLAYITSISGLIQGEMLKFPKNTPPYVKKRLEGIPKRFTRLNGATLKARVGVLGRSIAN